MRNLPACGVIAALLFSAAAAVHPATATASTIRSRSAAAADSVRGTVADSASRPVAGARVALVELARAVVTDSAGGFAFSDVPSGRYTITISAQGFGLFGEQIMVAGGMSPLRVTLAVGERNLPPVTVTAVRAASPLANSPLPVSEVGSEDLRREHSVSLARAIERVPGVRSLTTGEQIGKPVIRGLSGARVLVLDNGLRLEDYSWSDEDGPSVESRLADRIEIVRGPASLMYGSDAIGGVVNVVPAELPSAVGTNGFKRMAGELYFASNNGEFGTALRAEGASGRWGWRGFAVGRSAEDLTTPDGKLDNTGFDAVNGELAIGHHGSRGSSMLRYVRNGGEFKLLEAGGPPPGEQQGGGPERVLSDDRVQFAGKYVLGGMRLDVQGQWQRHDLVEKSDDLVPLGGPPDATVFDLLLNTFTGEVVAHRDFGTGWTGTAGASGEIQSSDSRGIEPIIPDANLLAGGAFAFAEYTASRFNLLGGIRADARRLSNDANADLNRPAATRKSGAVSADLGAVFRLGGGLALTANAGRAWRAPTLFELYANGPRIGENRFEIGDPNLDPEASFNVDGGLRWEHDKVSAEVSAFHDDLQKFIFIAPTGTQASALPVYRYEHADATLTGAEAAAELQATANVTLRARHDFVRGTNNETDSPLPLVPPARSGGEVELHGEKLGGLSSPSLGVEVEYNARQTRLSPFDTPTDGYTLVNLEAGFGAALGGHQLRVALRVRNLTDEAYRSYLSRYKEFALDPGRNIVVRVSTGF
jgi:iron complex outermembrane recepter protein